MTDRNASEPIRKYTVSKGRHRRSDGVLTRAEVELFRRRGEPLAFDPVQIGWVRQNADDDFDQDQGALSWSPGRKIAGSAAYLFRPWRPEDAPTLARLLSIPSLWTYLPETNPGPIEPNVALELIALNNGSNHHFVQAVEFKGKVIGQARLAFEEPSGTAELSYWLDPGVWGHGHGRAIVALFVKDVLRDYTSLTQLTARVHRDNPASARILTSAGFTKRGLAGEPDWESFALQVLSR